MHAVNSFRFPGRYPPSAVDFPALRSFPPHQSSALECAGGSGIFRSHSPQPQVQSSECRLLLGLLAVAGSPSIRPVAKAETRPVAWKPLHIGFLAVGTNIYEPLMCSQQLSIFCAVSAYMYRSCFITSKPALLAQMSAMLVLVTCIRLLSPENVVYQTAHWLATSAPGS